MHDSPQLMHKTTPTPIRVQLAGTVTIRRDVQLHQHPILELVYYLEGHVQCRIENTTVDCRPGMLRVIPPRVIHGEIVPTSFTCLYIWLELPVYAYWPQVYQDDASHTVGNVCEAVVREWNANDLQRETMLDLLLSQLDILLQRANDQHVIGAGEQLVREGERLLRQRFATPVTIGEIAATLGASPSYLRTAFVRLRGYTPMAYLQHQRAQHALALIQHSDFSLEVIAKLCGYDSSSHLSRRVKQATGARPGRFRSKAHSDVPR